MRRITAFISAVLISFTLSCKNDEDNSSMNRIIPPVDSMTIDFSSLTSIGTKSALKDTTPGIADLDNTEKVCLGLGTAAVAWSAIVCFTPLAIPIAIFTVLRNQIPTESSENRVVWSYSNNGNNATVVAVKPGANGYDWDWSVTINSFVWITGGSMEDKSSGWWTFHHAGLPAGADDWIGVEWTYSDNENKTVSFTNVNSNDTATYNDEISFTRTGDDISVRFYDVNSGSNNDGPLEDNVVFWNVSTKAGGITNNTTPASSCTWDPND